MKKIKILGAGLSGLSAAINLKKAGFDVEIFEKNSDCGMRFHGDLQGLENWTEEEDVLDSLKRMHIDLNFDITPFRQVTFTNCKRSEKLSFDRPLFYLVKRGEMKKTIDQGLKQQAIRIGVQINFCKTIEEKSTDIVATGPLKFQNLPFVDIGIVFNTNHPNIAVGIINDKAAYKGYAYLLIINGYGSICTASVINNQNNLNDNLKFSIDYFKKKYHLNINNKKSVGGIGSYSLNNIYQRGKRLYIGEAAGIQDLLAGFGMRTAITSGYLAAKSIIENLDYKKIANQKFKIHIRTGIVNRYAWEHLKIDNFITSLNKLKEIRNKTNRVGKFYNMNLIKEIEYPIALSYIKKNYPEILK